MRDYAKLFDNTEIDVSNFITEYNVVDNGIYISYVDKPVKFELTVNEEERLDLIRKIERTMKLQATTLFNTLYDKKQENLLQDMKNDKK